MAAPDAQIVAGLARAWRPIGEQDQTTATYAKGAGSFAAQEGEKGRKGERENPSSPIAHPSSAAMSQLGRRAVTDGDVLEEVRRADLRPLWVGRIAFLRVARENDRAEALKRLKLLLVQEDHVTPAVRLDRWICLHFIASILGWDEAQDLRVGAIAALCPLFGRNAATGEWSIKRPFAERACALWRRMQPAKGRRMPARAVKAEVDRMLAPKQRKKANASRKFAAFWRALKRLESTPEQLEQIIRFCQDRLAARNSAADAYERAA
jgi:hypothetical protein